MSTNTGATTLGDELPRQQGRVRELIGIYREIGPAGQFAIAMMEDALRRADKAVMEQDIVAMVRVCKELQEFKE
jgi:hypothetical protein